MIKNNFFKTPLQIFGMLLLSVSFLHSPVASADDSLLRLATSLCDAAKADDRSTMRKKLKSAKLRLRQIYDAVSCGATGSILRVAIEAGALESATFIATKIGDKGLGKPESDGKTVIQWTEELIAAGDASKQPFLDLLNSKQGNDDD